MAEKVTQQRITTTQRDRVGEMPVRASSEGYNAYLAASGMRFSGRPSSLADAQLADEARRTPEPEWGKLKIEELVAAEKLAMHRVSGGESKWKPVLRRIRDALWDARAEERRAWRATQDDRDLED